MHFRSFDSVVDLMVNLGCQMVEDYLCSSFSDCWAAQLEIVVFQKQRKARLKQMRQANSQNLAGSRWSNTTGSLCGGEVFECIPVLHIPFDFESPFSCVSTDSVSQRS